MPANKGKRCDSCGKIAWFSEDDRYSAECCGQLLNVPQGVVDFYVSAGFDAAKIKNSDKKGAFHNGLNEYIPEHATRAYVENRAAAKGLKIHWNTGYSKMRGTRVDVPKRLG